MYIDGLRKSPIGAPSYDSSIPYRDKADKIAQRLRITKPFKIRVPLMFSFLSVLMEGSVDWIVGRCASGSHRYQDHGFPFREMFSTCSTQDSHKLGGRHSYTKLTYLEHRSPHLERTCSPSSSQFHHDPPTYFEILVGVSFFPLHLALLVAPTEMVWVPWVCGSTTLLNMLEPTQSKPVTVQ